VNLQVLRLSNGLHISELTKVDNNMLFQLLNIICKTSNMFMLFLIQLQKPFNEQMLAYYRLIR